MSLYGVIISRLEQAQAFSPQYALSIEELDLQWYDKFTVDLQIDLLLEHGMIEVTPYGRYYLVKRPNPVFLIVGIAMAVIMALVSLYFVLTKFRL